MDIVRAFIGVHRFQIAHVAHHMEFVGNSVASMGSVAKIGGSQR